MRKPLYNIVIFIFHIITLILLFTLCIHFNVIKLDLLDFSKEAVASFFKNDYVVNIVCTILTAAALYIIQYPDYENMSEFLKLPVAQQNKISRKVQKKASKIYLKYRIRNFFK